MKINTTKRLLEEGKQTIGAWLALGSPLAAEYMAHIGFDWLLLMNVLFHGFLGLRTVVLDYVHRPHWREFTLLLLYTVAVIVFLIGTQVVLTLPSPTGAQ